MLTQLALAETPGQDNEWSGTALYTLFIPMTPGFASRIDLGQLLTRIQDQILDRFGGLTTLPISDGWWIAPNQDVYRDRIAPVQCVAPSNQETDQWFSLLAVDIAVRVGCQEVFLLKQTVTTFVRQTQSLSQLSQRE